MRDRPLRLAAVSAFERIAIPGAPSGTTGLTVAERRGLGLAAATLRRGAENRLSELLDEGFAIDLRAGSKISSARNAVLGGATTFVATGPRRWLVVEPGGGAAFAGNLAVRLSDAATIADQSSAYGVLRLAGPRVRDVLAKGVPLDLHESAFRPGDAAVTLCGHIGIVIWQIDDAPTYDIAVSRSYAADAWHFLVESAADFGLGVASPIA